MKQNLYFMHPITASFDPRMEAMEEKLHGKGYGGYWYIREKVALFLHDRCRLKDLKPFATKYFSFRLMKIIVLESDLFYFEGEYIVAKELNCEAPQTGVTDPSGKRGNQGKNTRKTTKKRRIFSKNKRKTAKNRQKTAKKQRKTAKNRRKTAKNQRKTPQNSPKTAEIHRKKRRKKKLTRRNTAP